MLSKFKNSKLFMFVILTIIAVALPLTVIQVQKQQEIRQRAAEESIYLKLVPENTGRKAPGGIFSTTLHLVNNSSKFITALDATIKFDKNVLILENFSPDPASGLSTVIGTASQAEKWHYVAVNLGEIASPKNDTVLGTLKFTVKSAGNPASSLNFSNVSITALGTSEKISLNSNRVETPADFQSSPTPTPNTTPSPAPKVTLKANSTNGSTWYLTWTRDAGKPTNCIASSSPENSDWNSTIPVSGTLTQGAGPHGVRNLTETTTFTLTCDYADGQKATSQVVITVPTPTPLPPTPTPTPSQASINMGIDPKTGILGTKFTIYAQVTSQTKIEQVKANVKFEKAKAFTSLTNDQASLILFDDGLHGDNKPNDGLYANVWDSNRKGLPKSIVIEARNADGNISTLNKALELTEEACKEVVPGHNDKNANRVNIVFVGASYGSFESFIEDVTKSLDFSGMEGGLFSQEPFRSNKDKFNFWYSDQIGQLRNCDLLNFNLFDIAQCRAEINIISMSCVVNNRKTIGLINLEAKAAFSFGSTAYISIKRSSGEKLIYSRICYCS